MLSFFYYASQLKITVHIDSQNIYLPVSFEISWKSQLVPEIKDLEEGLRNISVHAPPPHHSFICSILILLFSEFSLSWIFLLPEFSCFLNFLVFEFSYFLNSLVFWIPLYSELSCFLNSLAFWIIFYSEFSSILNSSKYFYLNNFF